MSKRLWTYVIRHDFLPLRVGLGWVGCERAVPRTMGEWCLWNQGQGLNLSPGNFPYHRNDIREEQADADRSPPTVPHGFIVLVIRGRRETESRHQPSLARSAPLSIVCSALSAPLPILGETYRSIYQLQYSSQSSPVQSSPLQSHPSIHPDPDGQIRRLSEPSLSQGQ